jgi:hypothetical protein
MQRAIKLSQAGNREDARRVLQAVIREEPRNELAWLRYLDVLSNNAECIRAIEQFLRIVPDSQRAPRVLLLLKAQKDRLDYSQERAIRSFKASFYAVLTLLLVLLCSIPLGVGYFLTHNPWQKEINLLTDRFNALAGEHSTLRQDYNNLDSEYTSLLGRHSALEEDYSNLDSEYGILLDQYNALEQTYNDLVAEHWVLRDQYDSLQRDHDSLIVEHNMLQSKYDNLQQVYNQLVDEHGRSISPPYIHVHNRTVQIAFEKRDQSIGIWEVPFESLEADILRGYESRTRVQNRTFPTADLTTNTGKTYSVSDYTEFVDSRLFAGVIPNLYYESVSASTFIREVWGIVTQLSAYSTEVKDTPRYPLETFLAGGGDCEDTSILFASMISAAPTDWEVDLVYMDSDNLSSPEKVNHVIVYIDTGLEHFYIETTNNQVMEPYDWVSGWHMAVEK